MNYLNWIRGPRAASRRDIREASQRALIETRRLGEENGRMRRELGTLTEDVRLLESVIDVLVDAFEKTGVLEADVVRQIVAARNPGEERE